MSANDAVEQLLAANVGITLTLISRPEPDFGLSGRVREAALAGVLHTPSTDATATRTSAAPTLHALVGTDAGDLTPGERRLLGELLNRLAR